jgi:hypothetical protein
MELSDDRCHISRRTCINVEIHGWLIGDFRRRELTVTPVPDVTGGVVQLMNEAGATIQHYRFAFDKANTEVRPALRAVGTWARLRARCVARARLRRRVHPTLTALCLRYAGA